MPPEKKRHAWYLRKIAALGALPPAAIHELADAAELRERPRKTCLYLAGDVADRVYFLHGGRVNALHIAGSHTINLGLYGPTDVFGESCLWSTAPREHMAITATAVLYTELPRALLRLVLDEHAEAARLFYEHALVRRDLILRRLSVALGSSVRARLADQLLALGEHGHDTPEGRELPFRLTHEELAALIGTTRETVSVELGRLERDGLIARERRKILLLDLARLHVRAREADHRRPDRRRGSRPPASGSMRTSAFSGAPPLVL
ncbi:MAG TPA: Crp/Fnr family transcriptional regulator [Nannocystis sp.]